MVNKNNRAVTFKSVQPFLIIEKYYTGHFDGELTKKHRKFESPDDLALFVHQHYSISIAAFTIHAMHIKSDFEVNRPE